MALTPTHVINPYDGTREVHLTYTPIDATPFTVWRPPKVLYSDRFKNSAPAIQGAPQDIMRRLGLNPAMSLPGTYTSLGTRADKTYRSWTYRPPSWSAGASQFTLEGNSYLDYLELDPFSDIQTAQAASPGLDWGFLDAPAVPEISPPPSFLWKALGWMSVLGLYFDQSNTAPASMAEAIPDLPFTDADRNAAATAWHMAQAVQTAIASPGLGVATPDFQRPGRITGIIEMPTPMALAPVSVPDIAPPAFLNPAPPRAVQNTLAARPSAQAKQLPMVGIYEPADIRFTANVQPLAPGKFLLDLQATTMPKVQVQNPHPHQVDFKRSDAGKAYMAALAFINTTYGAADEVKDAFLVLLANIYSVDAYGRRQSTMKLKSGDVLATLGDLVSGEAHLDTMGFVYGLVLENFWDKLYAKNTQWVQKGANRAGWPFPTGFSNAMTTMGASANVVPSKGQLQSWWGQLSPAVQERLRSSVS